MEIYTIYGSCEMGMDPYYHFTSHMLSKFPEIQNELKLTSLFTKLESLESMKEKIFKAVKNSISLLWSTKEWSLNMVWI